MRIIGLCGSIALFFSFLGCATHAKQLVPTPQLIQELGLPVYPNARPFSASSVNQHSVIGGADQLSVMFTTKDDFGRVAGFYAERVPRYAKRTIVPLGFVTVTTYQWYDKDRQKQVLLERVKDATFIDLRSMRLSLPASQATSN